VTGQGLSMVRLGDGGVRPIVEFAPASAIRQMPAGETRAASDWARSAHPRTLLQS
jgi:hypothetical protein